MVKQSSQHLLEDLSRNVNSRSNQICIGKRSLLRGTVSLVLVSVLIVTLLVSEQVCVECTTEISKGSAHLLSVYENATTHDGDLIINGTETYALENCTFIQTGNIYVRDKAKLLATNVQFSMNQTHFKQYELNVEDLAVLELKDTVLQSDYAPTLRFIENASGILDKVTLATGDWMTDITFCDYSQAYIYNLQGWCSFGFQDHSRGYVSGVSTCQVYLRVSPADTAHLEILNSRVGIFEILLGYSGETVEVNGLHSGFVEYLDLKGKVQSSDYDFNVKLNGTWVKWWIDTYYNSKTNISDSTITMLGIESQKEVNATVDGLEPRFYEFKKVGEVVLNKTDITETICIGGSGVRISNCKFNLMARGDSHFDVVDSVVYGINAQDFVGSLGFDNTTWSRSIKTTSSDFYVYGNMSCEKVQEEIWFSSMIRRNCKLIANDMHGNIVENASLTLLNRGCSAIWNGTTDGLGRADFNITFSDSNHTDWSQLNVYREGFYNVTRSISLLSSTPISIILTQKPLGDVNVDRAVNILDVSLVAYSFGCKPADSRWNDSCDLNNDNEINILDITLVAKDYGKTVK